MTPYEITFIVRPDLDDAGIDAVIDQVIGRIQTAGGDIVATLPWNPARRRMAYPIKDFGDGVYVTSTFHLDGSAVQGLENALKLNDGLLRFLVIQATDKAVADAQQRLQQRNAVPAPPPVPELAADAAPAGDAVAAATATPGGEQPPNPIETSEAATPATAEQEMPAEGAFAATPSPVETPVEQEVVSPATPATSPVEELPSPAATDQTAPGEVAPAAEVLPAVEATEIVPAEEIEAVPAVDGVDPVAVSALESGQE